jgi:hypothetical protein
MWTTENRHRYDRGARAARWLIAVHPLLEARGRRRITSGDWIAIGIGCDSR